MVNDKMADQKDSPLLAISHPSTPPDDNDEKGKQLDDEIGQEDDNPSHRSAGSVAWEGVSTYFIETSIHGFKYIVEDGAALWEKLFWTFVLSLSLTFAGETFIC